MSEAPAAREVGTTAGATPQIQVQALKHRYRTGDGGYVDALDDVSFAVSAGEVLTVVGPSGCGKSTLVHLIAGLIPPLAGTMLVDGLAVRGPGPDRGVVFQDLAILPWRTVRANIGHGLEIARRPRRERDRIVDQYVDLVGLRGFEGRYPHELSGGMKQRVAVARTLAADPKVILMDEPFAAVDAQTRITLQEELLRISTVTSKTILFVTHSVDEATFLGDRVMVLTRRPGRVKTIVDVPVPRVARSWDALSHDRLYLEVRETVMRLVRGEIKDAGPGTG